MVWRKNFNFAAMKEIDAETGSLPGVTDTGLWRLVVEIGSSWLGAWLNRVGAGDNAPDGGDGTDSGASLRRVARAQWDSGADCLHCVENAVYDNPAILDDYEADIVLTTTRYLAVPRAWADSDELSVAAYSAVYGTTAAEDLFADDLGEYAVLYTLHPGLKPFVQRTFAGARVCCHAVRWARHCLPKCEAGCDVFANFAGRMLDVLLCIDGRVVSLSSRPAANADEALYHIANACRAAGVETCDAALHIGGDDNAADVADKLTPYVRSLSRMKYRDAAVPAAVALCAYR